MTEKVVDVWFPSEAAKLSPSVTVRRWDTALTRAAFVFAATYALLVLLTLLPGLPAPVPGGYWLHVRAWVAVPLNLLTFDVWFSDFTGWYLTAVQNGGLEWAVGMRAVVTLGGAGWLGWLTLRAGLRPRNGVRHIEGMQLHEGEAAVVHAHMQAKALRGKEAGYMRLHPDLDLPKTLWTRHLLIYGSVGAGKTQILLPLLQQVFEQNRKALIYDVKGDFTGYFPDAILISPWDARSACWDIAADIDTPSAAATLAASLIPEEGGNAKFFSLGAQQLLRGVLVAMQNERGKDWGWQDLSDKLAMQAEEWAGVMLANLRRAAPLVEDPDSVTVKSLLSTLAAYTTVIDDLATAWGNGQFREKVSLRRWLRDNYRGKRQIIVQAGEERKLTSAYIAAMVNVIVPNVVSPKMKENERGRSIHIVLDEFTSVGQIDIGPLIDKGRSKGVCVALGVQDLAQIEKIYGKELTQSMAGMVGTHVVCRVNMGQTQVAIADLFGKRRVSVSNVSMSSGASGQGTNVSLHEENRAVLSPSDLESKLGPEQRGEDFVVKAIVRIGSDPLLLEWPGMKMPVLRKSFVPAAWTKAKAPRRIALVASTVPTDETPATDTTDSDTGGSSTGGTGRDVQAPVAHTHDWQKELTVSLDDMLDQEMTP